jgi:putative membrane protein
MADRIEHKAVKAQEKLADSAETLVDSAGTVADSAETLAGSADTMVGSTLAQEDSADRRTKLAGDRTLLASERTYAAWLRTGLAALAAGIGAQKLLETVVAPWLVLAASVVLLVLAEFCFVAAVWRELAGTRVRPQPDMPMLPGWLLVVFNGFLVLLGAAVLIGIVSR